MFLGASFMLYRGVADFNASKTERSKIKRGLERYYKANIFPSSENVKQELENSNQADQWFGTLMSELNKGNVISRETSPTKFKTAVYNVRNNLEKKARKAGTEMPEISASFAFGFERYAGTEGTLPKSEDVARLIEQLVIVNRISTVLFDNNIKSLSSVKRDVFEVSVGSNEHSEKRARGGRDRGARARQNPSESQSTSSLKRVGVIGDGDLFAKMHFVFDFRAKEKALLDILNAFSTHRMFIVVTSVLISKSTPVLVPDLVVSTASKDSGALDVLAHNRSKKDDEVVEPLKLGPNYPVCGIKMEVPMDVRIELDVYKFKEADIDSGN